MQDSPSELKLIVVHRLGLTYVTVLITALMMVVFMMMMMMMYIAVWDWIGLSKV